MEVKTKTAFFCQNCGGRSSKWQGRCSFCNEWNTITEEVINKNEKRSEKTEPQKKGIPLAINQIIAREEARLNTGSSEFNAVLGGGLVAGSVILLGGEPGIGKSTLLLQTALKAPFKTLYVSGEESGQQIKLRASRIGGFTENCFVLTETNTLQLVKHFKKEKPHLVIIDSVQTLQSAYIDAPAGSVSQIRQTAAELVQFAKDTHTPVFLVGHITKNGQLAGPKLLEHMVDTVLQFEGDPNHMYRLVRCLKNRFGPVPELGIFKMTGSGLQEVSNPSEILLSGSKDAVSGVAVGATLEGRHPLLLEVQALVSNAVYGTPQRATTGFRASRLNMLLAVLEKRGGFNLGTKDVFLNIPGGIYSEDPALDMAVAAAILSSHNNIHISKQACFAAEIGLTGEIRPVGKIEERIRESEKLGFEAIYVSEYQKINSKNKKIEIVKVNQLGKLIENLFA